MQRPESESPMDITNLIINAGLALAASLITAVVTARWARRVEREKWQREFRTKYAEARAAMAGAGPGQAEALAIQHAVGFLRIYQDENTESTKVFVPMHCVLTVGRESTNDIVITNPTKTFRGGMRSLEPTKPACTSLIS